MSDLSNQQLKEMRPGSLVYDKNGLVWMVATVMSSGKDKAFSLIRTNLVSIHKMMREGWCTADSDAQDLPDQTAAQKKLMEALSYLPTNLNMVAHCADDGDSYACCGESVSINHGRMDHAKDCWLVGLRVAVVNAGGLFHV